ncbi:metalloproteinase inhibitor 2-like [Mercenaria mercenaria]|uniref:metalloproteinase inhibitor 2-like n=1 Tax=Mercenaria mercenaria TaxID=6596 RepID=UPI00234E8E0D|nr:metalloproteinase inhibitor 2-like [Mercenaria mercenaria]XP_045165990.2 metalloproteinase inhibitor 2-like [Mercenaria mercenaria]
MFALWSVTMYVILLFIAVTSVNYAEACSCLQAHPQTQFCDADFVMQVRLHGKAEEIFKKERHTMFDKETNTSETIINRRKVAIKYNVKIKQIFKINENNLGLDKSSTVTEIYTAPDDGLCGVHLQERTNYLLSGKYRKDALEIDLCSSMFTPWPWVSKMQKKGLRFTYAKNCDCEIINPHFSRASKDANQCVFDPYKPIGKCHERNSACIHDKNSSTTGCKWMRNSKMRKCRQELKSGRLEP